MKLNSIIAFAISMLFFSSLYSQKIDEDPQYARAGFKGGVNYNSIMTDIDNVGSSIRIHVGAVVEFPITRQFFLQPELLYSAQGYTVDVAGQKQKVGLDYLGLPLIGKYYVGNGFSLETGPVFSLLNTITNNDVEDADPFFDSFNGYDINWAIGGGYKFESGMFFQIRYNFGISNISKTAFDITNSVAQLSVGYLFKTKNNRRIDQQEY